VSLDELVSRPLSWPAFTPRFPWWNGDLQTLASRFIAPTDLSPHASERLSFRFGDGDTLLGMLDSPVERTAGRPLVIVIHGLTGAEDSPYVRSIARHLLERGHKVLRLNLRGAGPSRPLCGGHYYAGRSQDFRELLTLLPEDLTRDGIVAVGYSLGGAMLLKYLGEDGAAAPLAAAASVSAPIDLAATSRNMLRPRNLFYHGYLLRQMKREATGEGAHLSAAERSAILGSVSIRDYDDRFIAPRHGFADADDYYERCRPLAFMPGIRVPTLVLASLDDPWIPGALYSGYDWPSNKALVPLLPAAGGHVGFHGAGDRRPWSDHAVARFFGHG
jgi:predicted alpha/beta-fold hydrolase